MHDRATRRRAMDDPRRTSYDAKKSLLSLCITFVIAALVFGGFYFFSPLTPEVPTGPAVTQPINSTPAPSKQDESAPPLAPTAP